MTKMKWKNPLEELPVDGQVVWIMMYPHKYRGSFAASAPSIEICSGEAANLNGICRVENFDELGMGSTYWYLGRLPENFSYDRPYGMAWIAVEDMPSPNWEWARG